MLFSNSGFEPNIVALMGRVCDSAWAKLEKLTDPENADDAKGRMVERIWAAAATGEKSEDRLMAVAMNQGEA